MTLMGLVEGAVDSAFAADSTILFGTTETAKQTAKGVIQFFRNSAVTKGVVNYGGSVGKTLRTSKTVEDATRLAGKALTTTSTVSGPVGAAVATEIQKGSEEN